MKIKTLLLTILITLIQPVSAEEDMYDFGIELAACSAKFETLSVVFEVSKDPEAAKFFKERSNGWLVGSAVSFMADGIDSKIAWSAAKGEKETTATNLTLKLKFASKSKVGMEDFMSELTLDLKECAVYDDYIDIAVKTLRKSI